MSVTTRGMAVALFVTAMMGVDQRTNGQLREPQRQEIRGVVKSVNAGAGTITITTGGGREAAAEQTYTLAKNVEVAIAGTTPRPNLFQEGQLADLSVGVPVGLLLAADQKTVESLVAEGPMLRGQIKAVDAAKKTLTLSVQGQRDRSGDDRSFVLAADTEVAVDDGQGRRFSIKEGKLSDLLPGALASLRLSLDQKQVLGVLAEGPLFNGVIRTLDAANKSLTLVVRPARGDDSGEEKILALARDVVVLVDDGKGRRLSIKEGKLSDVPAGSAATVKMSVDQTTVTLVRAEGPTLSGLLKAVDESKGTITITVPRGRGEAPEEKTFVVAPDARITEDGNPTKLSQLKVAANGPLMQLRLSLDQKSVQAVTARQFPAR